MAKWTPERRAKAAQKMREINEKRKATKKAPEPPPVVDEEPKMMDLGTFAQSILGDEATRQGIRDRAKLGTLTAQEMRALIQWSLQAPPEVKRPSQWKSILEAADPIEVQMIANISRRAMKQAEVPIYLTGQTQPRTNAEIIDGPKVTVGEYDG